MSTPRNPGRFIVFGALHYYFSGAAPSVHDLPTFLVTCLALVITVAFAMLSWRVFERPLIRRAHARYRYGHVEPEVTPRRGLIPS
jgi:peptidoglycan/LPS O-acetylase OafA/YrhL